MKSEEEKRGRGERGGGRNEKKKRREKGRHSEHDIETDCTMATLYFVRLQIIVEIIPFQPLK